MNTTHRTCPRCNALVPGNLIKCRCGYRLEHGTYDPREVLGNVVVALMVAALLWWMITK